MFSIADMAVAGAVALLLFGPDQLPKVARRAGQLVRDVQNTSQSFIREMERAADAAPDAAEPYPGAVYPAIVGEPPAAPAYHETPDPAPHDLVAKEAALGPHPGSALSAHPEAVSVPLAVAEPHSAPAVESHAGPAPNEHPGLAEGSRRGSAEGPNPGTAVEPPS